MKILRYLFLLALLSLTTTYSYSFSIYSRLTPSVQAKDNQIELSLKNLTDSYFSNQEKLIFINSYNQKVIIIGNVSSQAVSQEILNIVKNNPNVRMVFNELSIEKNYNYSLQSTDLFIKETILNRLSQNSNFPINSIKVFVFNRSVYLMGVLTKSESEVIKSISSKTPNAKDVYAYFDIITDADGIKMADQSQNELQNAVISQPAIPLKPPTSFSQGKRLALVIGNSAYQSRPLNSPKNDADDVSKALKGTGFEVIDLRDATLPQMRLATRQFGERLMSNDVGLVYYSGHGIEVKGKNYFIPVNADIKSSDEVADQALDVSLILAKMDSAKKGVNILIVDACRDDPFGRSYRSNSRGLAAMDAPQGTIIAYATSPGNVASDGAGRNSPYTRNLVKAMQTPNLPVELMFKEVRRAVREETKNQQTPWENTSLSGNFYFSTKK
jgi:osmotically-inducible protein OsmY